MVMKFHNIPLLQINLLDFTNIFCKVVHPFGVFILSLHGLIEFHKIQLIGEIQLRNIKNKFIGIEFI